jgi:hypothetical protein
MSVSNMSDHWRRFKAENDALRASGKVIIRRRGARLHVIAPLNHKFKSQAMELLGKWRGKGGGYWSFSVRSERLVIDLARKVFGPDKVEVQ